MVLTDRANRAGVRVTPHGLPATPAGVKTAPMNRKVLLLSIRSNRGRRRPSRYAEAQCPDRAVAAPSAHPGRPQLPLPLFHVNAQVVGLLATLVAAMARWCWTGELRRTGFWELLCERDITWVNAARDPRDPRP